MPIYAYRCSSCGCEKDILRKMSDEPLTTCPECHSETFSKQLSAPGFHLKGTGWYATDFKDTARAVKPETKVEAATDIKVEGKADVKGEAKPDAKVEAKTDTKADVKGDTKTASSSC